MRIEAQMTLPDGRTPGKWRKGSAIILSCIAQGCRIYPNPLNKIPPEWEKYVHRGPDVDFREKMDAAVENALNAVKVPDGESVMAQSVVTFTKKETYDQLPEKRNVDADSNGGHPGPVVVPDTDHEPVVVPQLTTQRKRGRPKKNA